MPTQIDTEPPAVVGPTEFEDCATAAIALGRELTDVITTAGDAALAEGFRSEGMAQLDSREAFLYAAADLGCEPEAFAIGVNDYLLVRLAALEAEDGAEGRERMRIELVDALHALQDQRGEGPDGAGASTEDGASEA